MYYNYRMPKNYEKKKVIAMSRRVQQKKKEGKRNTRTKQTSNPNFKRHTEQKSTTKKTRKVNKRMVRQHHSYTMLAVFVFFVIAIYLVGYIIAFINRPSIPVETVVYGNIDTPVSLQGLIVRDEKVINSKKEGKITYNFSENEKVKKGSVVCDIRNESTANVIEDKIDKIDKDILKNQKKRSDLSRFQEDIQRIEENISKTVDSYEGKFLDGEISNVYPMRSQIDISIDQRNEIWMAENAESLSELSQRKLKYEEQLAESVDSISANYSGILSFRIDGMEDSLTPDKISSITKEQTRMDIETTYLSKVKHVKQEEPIFKLVINNQWDIVSYVPIKMAADWEVGDTKVLESTVGEEEKSVSVTIKSLEKMENEAKVVFHATKKMLDFIGERKIDFTVKSDSLKGIKIPNNAIIEKTLLKLPLSCIKEEDGEQGVIKMSGNKGTFVKLSIARYNKEEGYVYVIQDFNSLKVGEVILKDTENIDSKYTIEDIRTYKGVYVANSSIAKFTMVDILGQNTNYSIVKPGSNSYELQAYDTIVSDAKKIEEGQVLY